VTATDVVDETALIQWEVVVRAVSAAQSRVFDGIEAYGVPAQWFSALHLLLRSEGHRLPMTHLARDLSMTSGGFTKLADRMGRDGLIDRRGAAGDRRVVYATLTEKGLALTRRLDRHYAEAVREHVLAVLTPGELDMIAAVARALDQANVPVSDGVPADTAAVEAGLNAPFERPARDPALPDRRGRVADNRHGS
jgi:DNA-binding MarR family transcriptional regulator